MNTFHKGNRFCVGFSLNGAGYDGVCLCTIGSYLLNERRDYGFLAVLSLLMGFASISTDLYLPAMPAMASELRIAPGLAAMTVSMYLVGFSLGQLVWGPLSDRYGRRGPLMIGLLVFVVGSVGCALAGSGAAIVGWRAVQAVGACAGVVIARAMVRDRFEGTRGAQVMSTLMTIMALAPLLGPVVGSTVLRWGGSWRLIFGILVVTGMVTLAAVWTLPETLPSSRRAQGTLGSAFKAYGALFREWQLLAFAGSLGFFFAATFAYIAASPFVYITYFKLSPGTYALIFSSGIVGMIAANMMNRRLVSAWGPGRLLRIGAFGATAAIVVMMSCHLLQIDHPLAIVIPAVAFVGTTGFVVANAVTAALASFARSAGSASALLGAIQYGGGIVGAAAVGVFANGTPGPMIDVMLVASICCAICALVAARTHQPEGAGGTQPVPVSHA